MAKRKPKNPQLLIRNYGLFWHRNKVNWGKAGNKGHLQGRHAKTGTPVDFRTQQGIYCLYDDNFRLVYVGQTNIKGLFFRLKVHTKFEIADRWTKFSWFGVNPVTPKGDRLRKPKTTTHPKISDVLNHIEAILIASAEPPHNSQSGRFGDNVVPYMQDIDDYNSDVGLSKKLDEVLKTLNLLEKNSLKKQKTK